MKIINAVLISTLGLISLSAFADETMTDTTLPFQTIDPQMETNVNNVPPVAVDSHDTEVTDEATQTSEASPLDQGTQY
jgi:hypothetical protein